MGLSSEICTTRTLQRNLDNEGLVSQICTTRDSSTRYVQQGTLQRDLYNKGLFSHICITLQRELYNKGFFRRNCITRDSSAWSKWPATCCDAFFCLFFKFATARTCACLCFNCYRSIAYLSVNKLTRLQSNGYWPQCQCQKLLLRTEDWHCNRHR